MNTPGNPEIIHLKSESDFRTILSKSTIPVIVDFHAEWCGPCKKLGPMLEEKVKTNNFKLVTVNVDDFQEIAEEYNVGGIPHVILFIKGAIVTDFTGFNPQELERMLTFVK